MGRFLGTAKDRCWPRIVSHFHVTGVRCGHITAAENLNLSVCYRGNSYLDKSNLQILYYEIAECGD